MTHYVLYALSTHLPTIITLPATVVWVCLCFGFVHGGGLAVPG
jgi:hypothetical protein